MRKLFLLLMVCAVLAGGAALIYFNMRPSMVGVALPAAVQTSQNESAVHTRDVPPGFVEYARQNYHFSILLPETVTIKEQGGTGDEPLMLVVQDPSSGYGFQIYAFPYNLPTITQERFKIDEPSGVVKNQKDVRVAGAKGTMFESTAPVVGALREIWFINNGIMYEVTTALKFDDWIRPIMGTWQFIE